MKIFLLNKAVLLLRNNAAQFLNGLTANTLDKPQNAFLNIHGRIVAAFEQLKLNDEEVLIVIEKPFVQDVLNHLERYVKLAGIKIEEKNYNVCFDLNGDANVERNDYVIPHKKGRMIITERHLDPNVSCEEFSFFRLKNNMPVHGIDFKDEMLLNVSETDHVSFTKGCFLGQEFVSKVHSRSKPTWKLVAQYEDECNEEERAKMTSKTLEPATKRVLGFVFVKNE